MTQANKALFDFQDDIMEMTSDSHKTIIRALELLDMVERGGWAVDDRKLLACSVPQGATESRKDALRGYNQAQIDIQHEYILIDRSKL